MLARLAVVPILAIATMGCFDREPAARETAAAVDAEAVWTQVYPETGHPVSAETDDPRSLALEAEIEALVNGHRLSMGLNALIPDPSLRSSARAHSAHMIAHGFFDHRNPEGDDGSGRLARIGLDSGRSGENIAAGYASAPSVFAAWLGSAGHRTNVEDPGWTHHGGGYASSLRDPRGYVDYWTHVFRGPDDPSLR